MSQEPLETFQIEHPHRLTAEVLLVAERLGILLDNKVMLSVGELGALPWASVKIESTADLSALGPNGEADFVMMNSTGTAVCGVMTEEDEICLYADRL